ncbi:hypothetical protein P3L10_005891 [Capsicum annuum]
MALSQLFEKEVKRLYKTWNMQELRSITVKWISILLPYYTSGFLDSMDIMCHKMYSLATSLKWANNS